MVLSVVPPPASLLHPPFLNLFTSFIFILCNKIIFLPISLILSVILSLRVSPLLGPAAPQLLCQNLTPTQCSPLLLNYLWPVIWTLCYPSLSITFTFTSIFYMLFYLLLFSFPSPLLLPSLPHLLDISVASEHLFLLSPPPQSPLTLLFCWFI